MSLSFLKIWCVECCREVYHLKMDNGLYKCLECLSKKDNVNECRAVARPENP